MYCTPFKSDAMQYAQWQTFFDSGITGKKGTRSSKNGYLHLYKTKEDVIVPSFEDSERAMAKALIQKLNRENQNTGYMKASGQAFCLRYLYAQMDKKTSKNAMQSFYLKMQDDKELSDDFRKALKDAGYNAMIDYNDSLASRRNMPVMPMIVFDRKQSVGKPVISQAWGDKAIDPHDISTQLKFISLREEDRKTYDSNRNYKGNNNTRLVR